MIGNASNIADQTLLKVISLEESDRLFFPCGSRYFGYFTPESDYDFFFQQSDLTCAWLTENGFCPSQTPLEYMDVNTFSTWYNLRVQVMEVRSSQDRVAIQDYIIAKRQIDPSFRPPKGDRKWWNERYCEMFPDKYKMPEELTSSDKQAFREESRGFL